MKTTFEHKFGLGDKVWRHAILDNEAIEGTITRILCSRDHIGKNIAYVVDDSDGFAMLNESEVFATKAELLKALNHDNKN